MIAMFPFQSDSSGVPTAVKVINKSAISNSPVGPATITTAAKKMVIKSEPPQLTNFTTAKASKTSISSAVQPIQTESSDTKMVQIPLPEYVELVKQVSQFKELKERLAKLEEHCERSSGFIRNKTTTSQH